MSYAALRQAKREMLKIVTYTSTEKGSATQDGVYLQLTGTESKSRMISLNVGPHPHPHQAPSLLPPGAATRSGRSGCQPWRCCAAVNLLLMPLLALRGFLSSFFIASGMLPPL